MGVCLSCLKGSYDDEQSINETTPLINEQHDYDKDARLRAREDELNQIVNDTNEQLIDIQSFFNPLEIGTKEPEDTEPRSSKAKLITNEYMSPEEKSILNDLHTTLFQIVEKSNKIEKKGPLVATFN